MVMQVPQSCASEHDDLRPTSFGQSRTSGGLQSVPTEALPSHTIYTRYGKRILDSIAATAILLVLVLPMLIVTGVIHLTSPGGPIYSQVRVGRHRSTFRCHKFRTMVHDADIILLENPQLQDAMAVSWKLTDDPRVTRIGRFLRKTSLDELPQLVNVIRGDMSLVGPRPVQEREMDDMYGEAMFIVASVRPGMTGLWQVSGRSRLTYEERVALDKAYVERVTFGGDLILLFRTVKIVFNRDGAF